MKIVFASPAPPDGGALVVGALEGRQLTPSDRDDGHRAPAEPLEA